MNSPAIAAITTTAAMMPSARVSHRRRREGQGIVQAAEGVADGFEGSEPSPIVVMNPDPPHTLDAPLDDVPSAQNRRTGVARQHPARADQPATARLGRARAPYRDQRGRQR